MKRPVSVLIVLLMVFALTITAFVFVSGESLYIRKVVSVVYDDSGSMYGEKRACANYAMQTFCGMLNSEDRLFITYMSDAEINPDHVPDEVDLSAGSIQNSVDDIKSHNQIGKTPYGAVTAAFRKLQNIDERDPNTQYWLVVITDGDFDEIKNDEEEDKKAFLNERFGSCADQVMANGTKPFITFLGIGEIASPDENQSKGIYTYSAKSAKEILSEMDSMADRVSGRTRLTDSDIEQNIGPDVVEVSSSVPLLNIALLAQNTDAVIEEAQRIGDDGGDAGDITIGRSAVLGYPDYDDLSGVAYLLGDLGSIIPPGTYIIHFDKNVDKNDIVVLFEPAIEVRMTIKVNGTEISDTSELDDLVAGDKLSASAKIYEMGTDKEIASSLMPDDTQFELSVYENGVSVESCADRDMQLSEYTLKEIETAVKAAVKIKGFKPIESSVFFTPTYPIVYTVGADYGSDEKSVKLDDIAENKDMTVCFTVYANGTAVTDPEAVKALEPEITVSPDGNTGSVAYTDDGKIVFTPNASNISSEDDGIDVKVTCTLNTGAAASKNYSIVTSDYQVVGVNSSAAVKKTEFFDNKLGASFYVLKDGVQLKGSDIEGRITASLNDCHDNLKTTVDISDDGTVTVIPYTDEEHRLTFFNWWKNWAYYFGLEGEDVVVTLDHTAGSTDAIVDVVEADLLYILLNVALPLIIELAVLGYLLWWIYAIMAKPKFVPGSMLYFGSLYHGGNAGNRHHEIGSITAINLENYNKLKYRWCPTLKSKVIFVGKGIYISAGYGGSIICHCQVWYKGDITPKRRIIESIDHPDKLKDYISMNDGLKIKPIVPYDGNTVHAVETIDRMHDEIYYVQTKMSDIAVVDGIETIESGTIFAYAMKP